MHRNSEVELHNYDYLISCDGQTSIVRSTRLLLGDGSGDQLSCGRTGSESLAENAKSHLNGGIKGNFGERISALF